MEDRPYDVLRDTELERQAAEKRVKIRCKARRIMLEIRQAAQADGINLTAEQCKALADAWELDNV